MPNIFYRKAIEAAVHPDSVNGLRDENFEDWTGLAAVLDKLTLEQRCDAVYADWLLQLHSPAHQALLQIRNLLIGQGALAANYLAELAQNADDAAIGDGAEIRIVLDGDWLFVANNGRKVTSMNLLGLSRFFVHAADQIRELNAETIGRFGIGFKSSYRIASEVLVHTWERNDAFTFRLPICRDNEPAAHPNHDRLDRLVLFSSTSRPSPRGSAKNNRTGTRNLRTLPPVLTQGPRCSTRAEFTQNASRPICCNERPSKSRRGRQDYSDHQRSEST